MEIDHLENRINQLELQIEACCSNDLNDSYDQDGTLIFEHQTPYLLQNAPNPFNQETIIRYFLPQTTTQAHLQISDLSGKQLETYVLVSEGRGSLKINAQSFPAGIYLYTLVIDGKVVDTKKMVITW